MPGHKAALVCSTAEINWLAMRDGRMATAISRIGPIKRTCQPDAFCGLAHAITGQQISSRAHASIWNRITTLAGPLEPRSFLEQKEEDLRSCGLSARKIEFLRAIAEEFLLGKLNEAALREMSDAELSAVLSQMRGIGAWTVEMLLIFTFQRKNIISFTDLAIRRGLMRLHGLANLDRERFEHFRQLYEPCNTAASLYLWEIAARKSWPESFSWK